MIESNDFDDEDDVINDDDEGGRLLEGWGWWIRDGDVKRGVGGGGRNVFPYERRKKARKEEARARGMKKKGI